MRKQLKYCSKTILYIFLFIIINIVLFLSVVRLSTPLVNNYKDEIQLLINKESNYPIVFESIHTKWNGINPTLALNDIILYTKDNKKIITKASSVGFNINLLSSIFKLKIITDNIYIDNINFELTLKSNGALSAKNNILLDWVLEQKYISIKNSSLTLNDQKITNSVEVFENINIDLKNKNNNTKLSTSLKLPELYGKNLNIHMDISGDIRSLKWQGDIYLKAEGLKSGSLFEQLTKIDNISGNANIELKTNWRMAKLVSFSGLIDYEKVLLKNDNYKLPIDSALIDFDGIVKNEKNIVLKIKLDKVKTKKGFWSSAPYEVLMSKNSDDFYDYSASIPYLKLEKILPLIIPQNTLTEKNNMNWLSTTGELSDIDLSFSALRKTENIFKMKGGFKDISIFFANKANSISKLDGSFKLNHKNLKLILNSPSAKLDIEPTYGSSIQKSIIKADIDLMLDDINSLAINKFDITNDILALSLNGKIKLEKKTPFLDIVVNASANDVNKIATLLYEKNIKELIKNKILKGKLLSAELKYQGYIKDFPFNNSKGKFKSTLNLQDVTFNYSNKWPTLEEISANVVFENNDINIDINSGRIYNSEIDSLNIKINDINKETGNTEIKTKITGNIKDLTENDFVRNLIAKDTNSVDLNKISLTGDMEFAVNINIPFNDRETTIKGDLSLSDAILKMEQLDTKIKKINGKIHFNQDLLWGEKIQALYKGSPIDIVIPKEDDDNLLIVSGIMDEKLISQHFANMLNKKQLTSYIKGSSTWLLNVYKNKKNDPFYLEFKSDLNGIAIFLPTPFTKQKDEKKPLHIRAKSIDSSTEQIDIKYNENINANIIVNNNKEFTIRKIKIGMNHSYFDPLDVHDIAIIGKLDKFESSKWMELLNKAKVFLPKDTSLPKKSILIEMQINKMDLIFSDLTNVNFTARRYKNNDFLITLNANETKGQAKISMSSKNKSPHLYAKIDALKINKFDNTNNYKKSDSIISNWPELDINIDKFYYNNTFIGKTELSTKNTNNAIVVNKLSFEKPGFRFKTQGRWEQSNNVNHSYFLTTVNSKSIANILEIFDYNINSIEGDETNIVIDAYWSSDPLNISLHKMEGKLDINIASGSLKDVSSKAGRLLGLLSLNSLPKRLSLDFSDLFKKGFNFETIKGSFFIKKGLAYTDDLEINTPSVNIIISGYTDLIRETYDQVATVKPKISDMLPLSSIFFGPVGAGIGAAFFVAGKFFDDIPRGVNNVLQIIYTIRGSWEKPHIELLNRN